MIRLIRLISKLEDGMALDRKRIEEGENLTTEFKREYTDIARISRQGSHPGSRGREEHPVPERGLIFLAN